MGEVGEKLLVGEGFCVLGRGGGVVILIDWGGVQESCEGAGVLRRWRSWAARLG